MAYMPLYQFILGELKAGAFQMGTKAKIMRICTFELTSDNFIMVRHMDSPRIIKFEIHLGIKENK